MKKLIALIAIVLAFSIVSAVAEVDVTGKWEITTVTQRGDRTSTVEFKQSGEDLVVTMQGRQGGTMTAKGTVRGDRIEWSITRETPRGEFKMDYSGTVSGDQMKGKVQFGEMGSGEWRADGRVSARAAARSFVRRISVARDEASIKRVERGLP